MKLMFPYNDTENAWISGTNMAESKLKHNNHDLFISMFIALFIALFATLMPTLMYFSRLNLL